MPDDTGDLTIALRFDGKRDETSDQKDEQQPRSIRQSR